MKSSWLGNDVRERLGTRRICFLWKSPRGQHERVRLRWDDDDVLQVAYGKRSLGTA